MDIPRSQKSYVFDTVIVIVMILLAVIMLYPFINVLAISFNDAFDSIKGGIYLWPRMPTLDNYREIFRNESMLVAARNSVMRTFIGTVFSVFCSAMMAYTLSRKDFMARRLFSLMFVVTMYVSGGLIPSYLLMRTLGLFNSFWVYIWPALLSAWNIFLIRSYMEGLPDGLQESAKIDGANDIVIFIRIVLPLSLPVLACIALFNAVGQWSSWFDSYLYNNARMDLTTLQYELQKMLTVANVRPISAMDTQAFEALRGVRTTTESLRMAMSIVVTVPVLFVYPFLQKYFMTGLTLGAIKS